MRLVALAVAAFLAGCVAQSTTRAVAEVDSIPLIALDECERVPPADRLGALDVAIAIDASSATAIASGVDVDGDREVGRPDLVATGARISAASTDPEDSVLHAQLRAARSLIHGTPNETRFAIVAYSGVNPGGTGRTLYPEGAPGVRTQHATLESPLNSRRKALDRALHRVLAAGSAGHNRFSAGMQRANEALTDEAAARPAARRVVLFVSSHTLPTIPEEDGEIHRVDPAMKDAAVAAIEGRIVYHTFGVGEASEDPLPHTLSRIAGATGGQYHVVHDPDQLHCDLLRSLAP